MSKLVVGAEIVPLDTTSFNFSDKLTPVGKITKVTLRWQYEKYIEIQVAYPGVGVITVFASKKEDASDCFKFKSDLMLPGTLIKYKWKDGYVKGEIITLLFNPNNRYEIQWENGRTGIYNQDYIESNFVIYSESFYKAQAISGDCQGECEGMNYIDSIESDSCSD
jgi:hypothetical protein